MAAAEQQVASIEYFIGVLQQSVNEGGPEYQDPEWQEHMQGLLQAKHAALTELSRSRAAHAAAEFDARMRGDPFAEMMHPTIKSNPRLAEALGMSSMYPVSGSSSSNPAAGIYGAMKVAVQETLMELFGDGAAAQRLPDMAGRGKVGSAGSADMASAGAGSSNAVAAATAAAAAGGLKAGSRDKAAAAAKGVGVREVPQLKSWSTWGQMWQWFYEEKIQHPNKEGEEATRAELYSQNVRWAPINLKPRASEYNAMYKRINKHALELTQKWGRPVSVAEAAEELAVMEKKVTQLQNGGMTMYAFMVDCRKWLQAQAKKAADAVDDGAVEGE